VPNTGTSALPYCNASTFINLLRSKKTFLPGVIGFMAIRALMKYAVGTGLRDDNPAAGVETAEPENGRLSWLDGG